LDKFTVVDIVAFITDTPAILPNDSVGAPIPNATNVLTGFQLSLMDLPLRPFITACIPKSDNAPTVFAVSFVSNASTNVPGAAVAYKIGEPIRAIGYKH